MRNLETKDANPVETINSIRQKLAAVGIFLYENAWYVNGDNIVSVRVQDINFPVIGTNGKGRSRIAALASAYAEFMERLQNGMLLYTQPYGLMLYKEIKKHEPTATEILFDDQSFESMDIFRSLFSNDEYESLKEYIIRTRQVFTHYQFYHVNEQKEKLLPIDIMQYCSFSTGMCAGNSPEEALVQGLSEVFERFTIKQIVRNQMSIPVISPEALSALEVYKAVEEVEQLGYEVIIKDCSLSNTVPVVGLLIISPDKKHYKVSLGSHLNFEIALERCITEIFQGIQNEDMHKFILPIEGNSRYYESEQTITKELLHFFVNGTGHFPDRFITDHSQCTGAIPSVFIDHKISNREGLHYYQKIITDQNEQIYIKDSSFLGFPSYYIYVTKFSELEHITLDRLQASNGKNQLLKTYMLRLQHLNGEELQNLATILESWENITAYFNEKDSFLLSRLSTVLLDSTCDFYLLEYYFILSLIYFKLQKFDKAAANLQKWIDENPDDFENIDYYRMVTEYFTMRHQNISQSKMIEILSQNFDRDLVKQAMADLADSDNAFKDFILPNCGDCATCPVSDQCRFDIWKNSYDKLLVQFSQFDHIQMKMTDLFANTVLAR